MLSFFFFSVGFGEGFPLSAGAEGCRTGRGGGGKGAQLGAAVRSRAPPPRTWGAACELRAAPPSVAAAAPQMQMRACVYA